MPISSYQSIFPFIYIHKKSHNLHTSSMAKRSRGESITSPSDQQLPVSQSSTAPQPDSSDAGPPSSPAKYTQLDSTSSDYHSHDVMRCSLAPHREPISFASYEEYEVHYIQAHVNRCSECGRNFPTELFLSLHIEENHDPLIEARKARGERTVNQKFPPLGTCS